jgi:hypothetical protein
MVAPRLLLAPRYWIQSWLRDPTGLLALLLVFILWLITLAFAAVGHASDITVTINPATLSGPPGSVLDFFGTLTNNDAFSNDINSDSFTITGIPWSSIDDYRFLPTRAN